MNKELEEAKTRLYEFIHNINLADKTIDNIKQDVYTVLNYIDNSIPKEVIEKKIEKIKENTANIGLFIDKELMNRTDTKVQVLQELLEGK